LPVFILTQGQLGNRRSLWQTSNRNALASVIGKGIDALSITWMRPLRNSLTGSLKAAAALAWRVAEELEAWAKVLVSWLGLGSA
jgi:hypothetical protein